jgi:gliding motility-associated protein GldL
MSEFLESTAWKKTMAKVYGIGASVVIIGALFKIMHWPGAGTLLTIGLSVEAMIFFISAFEPLHEELDWTLVFPELGGLDPNDEIANPALVKAGKVPVAQGGGLSDIDRLLLKGVDNDEKLFEKLGQGLKSLTQTATALSDISNATAATKEYSESMKSASVAVSQVAQGAGQLGEAYRQSSEELTYSVGNLSDAYKKITQSLSVDIDFSTVNKGNASYSEKLEVLNKNLTALNAIFELQLEGGLDQMMDDIATGVKASHRYKEELTQLGNRLEKLNVVYGNMLSAMNVKL